MTKRNQYAVLCLDNDLINLDTLDTELSLYQSHFDIHLVTSISEGHELLQYIGAQGQQLAMVIARHSRLFDGGEFSYSARTNSSCSISAKDTGEPN